MTAASSLAYPSGIDLKLFRGPTSAALSSFAWDLLKDRSQKPALGSAQVEKTVETTTQAFDRWKDVPVVNDQWLFDTLASIKSKRARAAHDSAYSRILETAEWTAHHLSTLDLSYRPILAFGPGDEPCFATSTGDLYLNLTVDAPGLLTWYATADEDEFFSEAVSFDGRQLPAQLEAFFERCEARNTSR